MEQEQQKIKPDTRRAKVTEKISSFREGLVGRANSIVAGMEQLIKSDGTGILDQDIAEVNQRVDRLREISHQSLGITELVSPLKRISSERRRKEIAEWFSYEPNVDPEKAVDLITYLEETAVVQEHAFTNKLVPYKLDVKDWHARGGFKPFLEDIQDPKKFFFGIAPFLGLTDLRFINTVDSRMHSLKSNPDCEQTVIALGQLGPLIPPDKNLYDVTGYHTLNKRGDETLVQPIPYLLNLPTEIRNRLLSPDSLSWLREQNLRAIDYQNNPDNRTSLLLDEPMKVVNIPYYLHLASSPRLRSLPVAEQKNAFATIKKLVVMGFPNLPDLIDDTGSISIEGLRFVTKQINATPRMLTHIDAKEKLRYLEQLYTSPAGQEVDPQFAEKIAFIRDITSTPLGDYYSNITLQLVNDPRYVTHDFKAVTPAFLEDITTQANGLDPADRARSVYAYMQLFVQEEFLDHVEGPDKSFWEYMYSTRNAPNYQLYMFDQRPIFTDLVPEGKETQGIIDFVVRSFPNEFFGVAKKHWLVQRYGEDATNTFLQALPGNGEERRNALTHNRYDRTSLFLQEMANNTSFDLAGTRQAADFALLTEYVRNFGLSRTPMIFEYFKQFDQYQKGEISSLAPELVSSGIDSQEALVQRVKTLEARACAEEPVTDVSGMNALDLQLMGIITGQAAHKFNRDDTMATLATRFTHNATETPEMVQLPDGYKPFTINTRETITDIDDKKVRHDYLILRNEILNALETQTRTDNFKQMAAEVFAEKQREIASQLEKADERKRSFLEQDRTRMEEYEQAIQAANGLDDLVLSLVGLKIGKQEKKAVDRILRSIIFQKIADMLPTQAKQDLVVQLRQPIGVGNVGEVIGIIDDVAKAHVVNFQEDNIEGYWRSDIYQKLKGNRQARQLKDVFEPHADVLREELRNMQVTEGRDVTLHAIPDRGLMGEMAGYIANVCITNEKDIVSRFQNMIPYKFVLSDGQNKSLEGSALVFEVPDNDGNPILLVRPFNIPNETGMSIPTVIEGFFDELEEVGRKRGKQAIVIPGSQNAQSNYMLTKNYYKKYTSDENNRVVLGENFAFNSDNITNNCYIVRTIDQTTDVDLNI